MNETQKFCNIARKRSEENKNAFKILYQSNLYGQTISVLRQEIDTLVRILFLLNQPVSVRTELINQTFEGKKWKIGKTQITDKVMVELADELNGWTRNVYKFGCGFIHLSNFHDYQNENIFDKLEEIDKKNIISYLNTYHGFGFEGELNTKSIIPYLPKIFDKIRGNLECYIEYLEKKKH